jgi:hypothetical protein
MRTFFHLIILALPLSGLPVCADVYRCSGSSGEPSFSQRPCGSDSTIVVTERVARSGQAAGLRPGERAWLEERARLAGKGRRTGTRKPVSSDRAKRKSQDQAYRCRKKRRDLDSVNARLRRGYKPAQGEGLRRRRAAYEDYLNAFCQ